MTVEVGERRPNDSPKIQECFFVDLIPAEEFGVVAEISEEPGELPKRTFRAVESSRKSQRLKGSWFNDAEATERASEDASDKKPLRRGLGRAHRDCWIHRDVPIADPEYVAS